MPRIEPKSRAEYAEYEEMFRGLEEFFGFLPNDYLTMGHRPGVLRAVAELTKAVVFDPGETPMELRLLVPYISSRAARCMYCMAHCAVLCGKYGVADEKIKNIHQFETHPAFAPAERAALRVAERANRLPNAVTDDDFVELRKHYSETAVVEIVALVAMMAFYNRWNDTMATTLETPPLHFATHALTGTGWSAGKHVPTADIQ